MGKQQAWGGTQDVASDREAHRLYTWPAGAKNHGAHATANQGQPSHCWHATRPHASARIHRASLGNGSTAERIKIEHDFGILKAPLAKLEELKVTD